MSRQRCRGVNRTNGEVGGSTRATITRGVGAHNKILIFGPGSFRTDNRAGLSNGAICIGGVPPGNCGIMASIYGAGSMGIASGFLRGEFFGVGLSGAKTFSSLFSGGGGHRILGGNRHKGILATCRSVPHSCSG